MSDNLVTLHPDSKPVLDDVIAQLAHPELRLVVFGLPRTEEILDQLEIHCLAFTNVNTPMQFVMGEILEAKKAELGKRYQGWVATKPFSARTEARRRTLYKHCIALLKLHPDDHAYHKDLMDLNGMQIASKYAEAFPKPEKTKSKKAKAKQPDLQPKVDKLEKANTEAKARIQELETKLESKAVSKEPVVDPPVRDPKPVKVPNDVEDMIDFDSIGKKPNLDTKEGCDEWATPLLAKLGKVIIEVLDQIPEDFRRDLIAPTISRPVNQLLPKTKTNAKK